MRHGLMTDWKVDESGGFLLAMDTAVILFWFFVMLAVSTPWILYFWIRRLI